MSQDWFLKLINAEKFSAVEFGITEEELHERGYTSKVGYLLENMFVAVELIQKEYGNNISLLKRLENPNENMKKELVFIAAVCDELLKVGNYE